MITVFKFGPLEQCPDVSPFVTKLETWLRMAGIGYETRIVSKAKMPKGKLPVIDDDGRLVADSSFIIRYLEQKHGDPLGDASLATNDRVAAVAMKALFESQLYFVGMHVRWGDDRNFQRYKPTLLEYARHTVPAPWRPLLPLVAPVVFPLMRRQVRGQLRAQGTGRHTHDEIMAIGLEGWRAVGDFLGDKTFMLGDRVSGLDAVAYGFVEAIAGTSFESPVAAFVKSQWNLMRYRNLLRQRYWPEMQD